MSVRISLLSYFRFLFVLPAFYLLLMQGVVKLPRRFGVVVVICLFLVNLVTVGAYITMPRYQREDWRGLSSWIDSQRADSAISVIPNLAQADPYLIYQKDIPIVDSLESMTELPESFYLIRYLQEIFDPDDDLRHQIEELDYTLVEQKSFNGVLLWHYQRTDRIFAQNIYDLNLRL